MDNSNKKQNMGLAGNLTQTFMHSPLTLLLIIATYAIGIAGFMMTPRQEDPQISVPMADIFVQYSGASPEQVASLVTEPLERIMSEIPGVDHVYSASVRDQAVITVQFEVGEEMGPSLVKLYDKLESNMDLVPPGVSQPLVKPKGVDDVPIVSLTLWSDSLDDAAQSVSDIIAAGVTPSTMEFMDNITINAIQNFQDCGLPRDAEAVLLIETDGEENSAVNEMAKVEEAVSKNNVRKFARARDMTERDLLFAGRRIALNALANVKPNLILEDATVMRSKLPEMVSGIVDIAKKHALQVGIFGHAGDGNLHPTFLIDMKDKDEMGRTEKAVTELFQLAIDLDGTISGEHGIGVEKKPFLENQIGAEGIRLLQNIKKTFDPENLLNPGKMFDMV